MDDTNKTVGMIIAVIIFLPLLLLFGAWCVMMLWNLFLVPAVVWAHPIGLLQALGLWALSSFFFRSYSTKSKD